MATIPACMLREKAACARTAGAAVTAAPCVVVLFVQVDPVGTFSGARNRSGSQTIIAPLRELRPRCHKRCHGEVVVETTGWRAGPIGLDLQLGAAHAARAKYLRQLKSGDGDPVPF